VIGGKQCVSNGSITPALYLQLVSVKNGLLDSIEQLAPHTQTLLVLNYYNPIPTYRSFDSATASDGDPACFLLSQNLAGARADAVVIQKALNTEIKLAVIDAQLDGFTNVKLVDLSNLETNHEMCTGSPAIFSGEKMSNRTLVSDLNKIDTCVTFAASCGFALPSVENSIKSHLWRVGHPNAFGQQDIAKAVEAQLQ
jgi:hypothetical protein